MAEPKALSRQALLDEIDYLCDEACEHAELTGALDYRDFMEDSIAATEAMRAVLSAIVADWWDKSDADARQQLLGRDDVAAAARAFFEAEAD